MRSLALSLSWASDEIRILRATFPGISLEEILELLPEGLKERAPQARHAEKARRLSGEEGDWL